MKQTYKEVYDTIRNIVELWKTQLASVYGGGLEVDYREGAYYACAFHNDPKKINDVLYDNWIEPLKEIECLGTDSAIEHICSELGIPVCH